METRSFLHRPATASGHGIALTHGAGSDCDAPLLRALATALTDAGFTLLRYDLPFRHARRSGPPRPTGAAEDRAGIIAAIESLRGLVGGRLLAGGHSYGGRQTSITAAENSKLIDALLLLSYPLHPPRRPNELRTAHFSTLRTPCLFVHGTRDPFGSPDEMKSALRLIPVATELCLIEGAGHDLMNPADISRRIVDQVVDFVAAL